jgi:hypothetical protein
MGKGLRLVFISVSLVLVLSISLVSAGWFSDLFGLTGRATDGTWTQWYNRDTPAGTGDYEDIASLRVQYDEICSSPLDIECQTVSGVDYSQAGQVTACNLDYGFYCRNAENPEGCLDYRVRFFCGEVVSEPEDPEEPGEPEEPLAETCESAGYKCTSSIRGCGSYTEFDLPCEESTVGTVCCSEIPYCGDGVCFVHDTPGYGENSTSCPQDCGDSTTRTCTDSDGGKNYYKKGTLTKSGPQSNYITTTHDDFCLSKSSGQYVNEFYCVNLFQDSELVLCPNGCSEGACIGEPTTQTGYRFAAWKCEGDDEVNKEGSVSECRSKTEWKILAGDFCKRGCLDLEDASCGVESFSVGQVCTLESTEVADDLDLIEKIEAGEDVEDFVACENSCSSDGKCYPFGYRKSGEYCSDEGIFVNQFREEVSCENNFQCGSNLCVDSQCISPGFLQRILGFFRGVFGVEVQSAPGLVSQQQGGREVGGSLGVDCGGNDGTEIKRDGWTLVGDCRDKDVGETCTIEYSSNGNTFNGRCVQEGSVCWCDTNTKATSLNPDYRLGTGGVQ